MRKEYELKNGRPNPYAKRFTAAGKQVLFDRFFASEHLVRLDDDLIDAFPTTETVNEALRLVLKLQAIVPGPPQKVRSTRPPSTKRARAKR
jgi:hypothetical protein